MKVMGPLIFFSFDTNIKGEKLHNISVIMFCLFLRHTCHKVME